MTDQCPEDSTSPIAHDDDPDWTVDWISATQALLRATRDAVVCLRGRGRIRTSSSQSICVHGYDLPSTIWTDFSSAPWSSWITLSLISGDTVEIDSSDEEKPSFQVVAATRRDARPTIVPDSWRSAVQSIVEDYSALRERELPPQHSYAHASFFQDTVGDDAADLNPDSPSNSDHGYQIVFCGAKGVGKSTCLRYCLNRLLSVHTSVMVLDADPGQPEYTLPGMLQLTLVSQPNLQPPHMHVVTSKERDIRQRYYFGSVTTASDPVAYLRHIAALVEQYRKEEECRSLPLLVNLDGWIKDLGFSILTTLLQETLQPRHVIQISGDSLSKVLDLSQVVPPSSVLHRCWAYQMLERPIGSTNSNEIELSFPGNATKRPKLKRSASSTLSAEEETSVSDTVLVNGNDAVADGAVIAPMTSFIPASVLRDVRLISYMMMMMMREESPNHPKLDTLWDTIPVSSQGIDDSSFQIGNALAAARPFVVAMDSLAIRFTQSELSHDIRSKERLLEALNGSLVGLCQLPEEDKVHMTGALSSLLPCVGLGLVRSVDSSRRLLFLLTPVNLATLQSVNCLLLGTNVHLPVQCYFRGVHTEAFPYLSFLDPNETASILGADPMKSRNNINRRGRLSGSGGG